MAHRLCDVMEIEAADEKFLDEHLLLQELTHRINNELASTIGFLKLTAAQSASDEVKVALAGVIQHIHDFAGIYRALQMPVADGWVDAASELIANASRHAFRGGGGKIEVELLNRDACVECTVTDNGFGSENICPGQGLKIIRSLAHDLDGTIDHRSGTKGMCAMLRFPLHARAGE